MTTKPERKPLTKNEIRQHAEHVPMWLPTREEIKAECLAIQATWDEETRLHRLGLRTEHPAVGFGHTAGMVVCRVRGVSREDRKRIGD